MDDYLGRLSFSTESATAGLAEAMRYSLLAGGKRIRPVLTLATARALGEDPRQLLPIAAAIELIHTYSLVHDDLPAMDDDDLRRGRPTCHIAFGENVAILAGDGLMAEAYRIVLQHQRGEPERILAALAELSAAISIGGMVGGQYIDVKAGPDIGADELRHMHELKTGRLIATSIAVAALLTGAAQPAREALDRFAGELGVLFQIVDDILDVTGSDEELGKPQGSDERLGKRTFVSVFGLERARQLGREQHEAAKRELDRARGMLAGDAGDLDRITDFIHERNE